jgi:hypothetical protein
MPCSSIAARARHRRAAPEARHAPSGAASSPGRPSSRESPSPRPRPSRAAPRRAAPSPCRRSTKLHPAVGESLGEATRPVLSETEISARRIGAGGVAADMGFRGPLAARASGRVDGSVARVAARRGRQPVGRHESRSGVPGSSPEQPHSPSCGRTERSVLSRAASGGGCRNRPTASGTARPRRNGERPRSRPMAAPATRPSRQGRWSRAHPGAGETGSRSAGPCRPAAGDRPCRARRDRRREGCKRVLAPQKRAAILQREVAQMREPVGAPPAVMGHGHAHARYLSPVPAPAPRPARP